MIFISWRSFLSRALCKLCIEKEHAFIKSQKFHVLHLDSFDLDSGIGICVHYTICYFHTVSEVLFAKCENNKRLSRQDRASGFKFVKIPEILSHSCNKLHIQRQIIEYHLFMLCLNYCKNNEFIWDVVITGESCNVFSSTHIPMFNLEENDRFHLKSDNEYINITSTFFLFAGSKFTSFQL